MARIALFGGSFDPPHLGHVLAATCARLHGLDAVWVLPAFRHPYGKDMRPFDLRLDLCHAAFAPLGEWCVVRDDERGNPEGYTITLVESLRARHPGHEWFLIGGSDTAKDMVRWNRGAKLLQLVTVLAIPRRGWDDHPAALPDIRSSEIRRRMAAGEDWQSLVPPAVAERIRTERAYTGV